MRILSITTKKRPILSRLSSSSADADTDDELELELELDDHIILLNLKERTFTYGTDFFAGLHQISSTKSLSATFLPLGKAKTGWW